MDAPTTDDGQGAYPGFEGRVGRVFATSEPSWPKRRTAPLGAPNVVLMVADDLGFSDLGCYGSEIPTPHLDALAAGGLRYTNFHVAPLCSPTRASLLTGRNAHAVGMGQVAHIDAGFPGYTGELPEHQPSMAEMFRTNGFATLAVGKWHLCKNADLSEAGDKHSWPLQRGFDQYYGFLEALTNFHHPHRMYEGNAVVDTDQYPDGYYLTDDLTQRAVQMIREVKTADPAKPFFLYYAHGAVHAPLHAKRADIEALRGLYDEGWDIIRERRLARQVELGIVPAGTELPPRNTEPDEDVVAWDSLSADERTVFARYMECYAAMVRTIDDSVGAIRAELEHHGQLDNTIFIFTSDNGASREGRESGTIAYFRDSGRSAAGKTTIDEAITRLEEIGGPTTWPHYPRGWAMACNTPFRLYKISTFRGGHSVPLVVSWPDRIVPDQIVRGQYTHVTDILPTLADLIGLDVPTTRNGLPADPLDGVTFAATLADAEATTAHTEQYYECVGHRAFHRDGWHAVTFHPTSVPFSQDQWQLFDARADVNELHDLADQHPDRVAELVDAWEEAAWRNQVFPLDEGSGLSNLLVPPFAAAADAPVRILPGTPTLERFRASRLIARSTFGIAVEWDYQRGDQGILVAHGGQEGGYVLWVEDGELGFTVNALGTPMPVGQVALGDTSRRVDVRFEIVSPRMWKVIVDLDGTPVMERDQIPQMKSYLPYEGIDVGLDRRSPVSWDLHQRHGAFPFTGSLHAVTYTPGPATPEDDQRRLEDLRAIGTGLE
jgi:arylsulfatase A-like enzyme